MSSPPTSLPPILPPDIFPPEIAQVTAPLLFGITLSWMLYGMLVVQVYIYHICFKDRLLFQVFVYSVFILDTIQTCFTGADLFFWFGTGYGNISHLVDVHFAFFDTPMLSSLIALLIHSFFSYRIWVLSKSIIVPVLIIAISIISLVGSWISAIEGHLSGNPALTQTDFNPAPIYLWLIGTAVADTLIASVMTFLLTRSKGLHQRTNAMVQRIVILTMETNCLSAVLAIVALVLFFTLGESAYFTTPIYLIGKSYSNSLLVVLNNRFFLAASTPPSSSRPTASTSGRSDEPLSTVRISTNAFAIQSSPTAISESPTYKAFRHAEASESIELQERTLTPSKHPYARV